MMNLLKLNKKTLVVSVWLMLALMIFQPALAKEFKVDSVVLTAPHIDDYVLITESSDEKFFRLFEAFTTQKNQLIVAYVQTDEYNQIKQGQAKVGLKNYKLVQTIKQWEKFNFSNKDFAKIKSKVKKDWDTILQRTQQKMPEFMAKLRNNIKEQYDQEFEFKVNDIVPIDLMETENSVTTINVGHVKSTTGAYKMVMANTITRIKGKVVVLMNFRKFSTYKDIQLLSDSAIQTRDIYLKANQF